MRCKAGNYGDRNYGANYGDVVDGTTVTKPSLPPLTSAATLPRVTRIARIVVPGLPHHVTQRGNHRAAMFFAAGGDAL